MCVSPITITIREPNCHGGLRRIQVPCGKCFDCLRHKQNDWTIRILSQFKKFGYGIFFTLTYNNDSVPCVVDSDSGCLYHSVCKSHIQGWLKRFRSRCYRKHGKDFRLSYFITSEYGPRTLRPHYHGLIFGVDKFDFIEFALNDWQSNYGFTSFNVIPCNLASASARYVSKYCSKGFFENPLISQKIVEPTFHLVSKHFGESYVDDMASWHLGLDKRQDNLFKLDKYKILGERQNIRINGFSYRMPRYLKEKIYGKKSFTSRKVSDYLHEKSVQLLDSELEQIQSSWNCSFGEATYIHDCLDFEERLRSEEKVRTSLGNLYDHSKI